MTYSNTWCLLKCACSLFNWDPTFPSVLGHHSDIHKKISVGGIPNSKEVCMFKVDINYHLVFALAVLILNVKPEASIVAKYKSIVSKYKRIVYKVQKYTFKVQKYTFKVQNHTWEVQKCTTVYFRSTKVYFHTKVYFPSTKVYFQSTKVVFHKSILSKYKSLLSILQNRLSKYKVTFGTLGTLLKYLRFPEPGSQNPFRPNLRNRT